MTMTPDTPSKPRVPMDQVAKKILTHIASSFDFDAAAIAKTIGASEEVVRHRLTAMKDGGILKGVSVQVAPEVLGSTYEFLVSGVPTKETDRQAIERLCSAGGVTRVFGLASSHSVAFTVRGGDPSATQAMGLQLAKASGLAQAQAIMIVNTFHDRPGASWSVPTNQQASAL